MANGTFAQAFQHLPVKGAQHTDSCATGLVEGSPDRDVPCLGSTYKVRERVASAQSTHRRYSTGPKLPRYCPTQGFTISVLSKLAIDQWEAQYFNSTQLADPTISGATATPQNDGVPNLLKYTYNIDPSQPMTTAEKAMLPVVTTTATTQTLTYYQYSLLTSVTVEVQTSPDLQTWTAVSNSDLTQIGTDGSDAIMQAQVTITPPRQFIRLNVTSP